MIVANKLNNLIVTGLEVESVKRIRVVRLKPGPGLVEVSGKNRNGKSSLLDAIAMAIGGKDQIPWEPIRKGEQSAVVRVDLGNDEGHQLRITRRLTGRDSTEGGETYTTSLKIEDAAGAPARGAQTLLDSLVDGISFDPEEFMTAKADKQVAILRGLVPSFDFVAADKDRKATFDKRTEVNRDAKRLRTQAAGIDVPVGTPEAKVDASALIDELRALGDVRAEVEKKRHGRQMYVENTDRMERDAASHREEATRLRERADALEDGAATIEGDCATRREAEKGWPALEQPTDGADLQAKIADADRVNADVSKLLARQDLERQARNAEAISEELSKRLVEIDDEQAKAIASADLPADGLAIENDRLMLRGVPFDQASQAEQIRTSLAIGIGMNPRLKVMRIKQGNDLDEDAWALISEVALSEGLQVWVESIRPHSAAAIVMEDGEVKS